MGGKFVHADDQHEAPAVVVQAQTGAPEPEGVRS
jgi:hypothetical protein